jgi:hypothetical protein
MSTISSCILNPLRNQSKDTEKLSMVDTKAHPMIK